MYVPDIYTIINKICIESMFLRTLTIKLKNMGIIGNDVRIKLE